MHIKFDIYAFIVEYTDFYKFWMQKNHFMQY
jgi:hypothetical protein